MTSIKSFVAVPAMAAVLSLAATPVHAAELPLVTDRAAMATAPAWSPGDDNVRNHRYYRYRHRRGVDAGDVLAGVLIIGGIAAIATAAKNSDRRAPDRDWRYPDQRRGDYRPDYDDSRGIDRAVSMCVNEIERDQRIQTVDAVNRVARGWTVTGSLYNGDGFTCSLGEDGRIEAIDYGTRGRSYQGGYGDVDDQGYEGAGEQDDGDYEARDNRQYDDEYYAAARARTQSAQPDYPGGPVADEGIETADPDIELGTGYQGAGN